VVYGKWTISNSGRSLDLELATAPPGSFSDWNFNRLTLVGKASKTIKGIELRSRFIYGHMNHDTRSSVQLRTGPGIIYDQWCRRI